MKILIDIGHPAHVHLFKNFAIKLLKNGHKVLFTIREKEFEMELLSHFQFDYISFGKHYVNILGKLWGLLKFDFLMLIFSLRFKPELYISHGSIYAAHISWLIGKPHISLEDTFNFEQIKLYRPFTKYIITSDYDHPYLGNKEIRYSGYHELAYLHPNYYSPDESILTDLKVKNGDIYSVVRFVSWKATHDIGFSGISDKNKKNIVKELLKYGKVFISSEVPISNDLADFQLKIPPHRIHDVLAFSSLYYGESSTMAVEAAILGTPAIFINRKGRYYTEDIQKNYDLMYCFKDNDYDPKKALEIALKILRNAKKSKNEWIIRRNKLISDKIDLTSFLFWFVSKLPESNNIMNKNPDYQLRFK